MSERPEAPPSQTLVIVNPAAGTTNSSLVDDVLRLCRSYGQSVTVSRTKSRGDATYVVTQGLADPPDLFLVIGGDGTVREAATGLVAADGARRPPLFAVPGGTGNSGYRMLWGLRPWQEALSAVLRGDGAIVRRVDMARLVEADTLVLLGACSGLFAEALVTARSSAKRGWGRYEEALATTARCLNPFLVQVSVDGTVVHKGKIVLANVGGGRYRAGQYQLLPNSLIDDGYLDVCVVGSQTAAARILELSRSGGHLIMPGITYGRGQRVLVERLDGAPLCFEHDGEVLPGLHHTMTLDVVPHAVPMWGARVAEWEKAP